MKHWSNKYIGKPWEAYASGPDSFDCWGLVRHVLINEFNVHALQRYADVITDDHREFHRMVLGEMKLGRWRQVHSPVEGAVVLLARKKAFSHIGIVASTVVLHVRDGSSTCRESLFSLSRSFNRVEFWVHESLSRDS